jgi:hypothetical protein
MLHPFARMDITGMHRMLARLTVTTAQVGLRAESLSGLDPGSTGLVEDTGDAAVTMAAAATTDAAALPGVDRWLHLIGVRLEPELLEAR